MVIAKLAGGLGNQMFQYACAMAFAEFLKCDCKFDLDWFDHHTLHNGLEIQKVFGLNLIRASALDVRNVLGWKYPFIRVLGSRVLSEKASIITKKLILTENSFTRFLENGSENAGDVYMVGYWQSEDYFFNYKNRILSFFQFKNTTIVEKYSRQILSSTHSVSIHIRRGDYITDINSNNILGVCSLGYYRDAMFSIEKTIDRDPTYFVFSDDLELVKDQFNFTKNVVFVSGNVGASSYLDMYLMSLCEHHIIANSSFSWWGAWLGTSQNKIVYAPTPWFDNGYTIRPICPKNWLLLDKSYKDIIVL